MFKAIFFDRDGTLIDEPNTTTEAVDTWEQFKPKDDLAQLADLNKAGFVLFIISNQEAIDEGNLSTEFYDETNSKLLAELSKRGVTIERIYTCAHARVINCNCRKPKRGLIDQALGEYEIDIPNSYIVGDRPTDVLLGKLVNLKTVYIESPIHKLPLDLKPDFVAKDLLGVSTYILKDYKPASTRF